MSSSFLNTPPSPPQNQYGPQITPGLPSGPSSFTTYQLPGSSNDISVNMANLQECMLTSAGGDLMNNCIANNIKGLSNQSNSYQNIKYVGPGHNVDSWGRVTFGPLQHFQNIDSQNKISNTTLTIYIVLVILYLFIMLK